MRGLLLRRCMNLPPSAIGCGLKQFFGTWVREQLQAVLQGIGIRSSGKLVNETFMRKRIGQGRDAAQPRCTQERRHVVHRDTQVGIVVGRSGGAVTHFVGAGCRLDGAGQQQGQGRRTIGRVRGLKIVASRLTVGRQATAHLHQLRRTFGLPRMFLFAAELHSHRCANGLGQERCIGSHIICAIASIATGSLHAHNIHRRVNHATQHGQISTQHMGVLRPRPHPQLYLGRLCIAFLQPPSHRTRGANGGMHLVRPNIFALQKMRCF